MRVYIRAKLYIVFDFTIAELVKRICPGLISARWIQIFGPKLWILHLEAKHDKSTHTGGYQNKKIG